jgi:hypothetical protein
MENVRNEAKGSTMLLPVMQKEKSVHRKAGLQAAGTVQQGLYRWYHLLANGEPARQSYLLLFPDDGKAPVYFTLKNELENIPLLLMEELSSGNAVNDKQQYIRLLQALLVNISDELYGKKDDAEWLCEEIEKVLHFLQNFFYNYFDKYYRLSEFCMLQYHSQFSLKLDYWKIRLNGSRIIDAVKESVDDKISAAEQALTFLQREYLKTVFTEIESAGALISETILREILMRYNFNSTAFIWK